MNYAYVRVSSQHQNYERQINAIQEWSKVENEPISEIFIDKESGKDFDRTNYQKLRGILKEGDLVIIKSIDRLGRNYDMIIEEWAYITKTIKCDIIVIDLKDLLDTRQKKNGLTGKFIADMVLQILSYVAQTERENIHARQMEGIKNALAKGVKFGVESKLSEELWNDIKIQYEKGSCINDLAKHYKVKKITIYQRALRKGWVRGELNYNPRDNSERKEKKKQEERDLQMLWYGTCDE